MEKKMLDHLFGELSPQEAENRATELRELQAAGFLPQDEEPDEWVEEHPEPTDREVALGNALGQDIDIDDDEDNGDVS